MRSQLHFTRQWAGWPLEVRCGQVVKIATPQISLILHQSIAYEPSITLAKSFWRAVSSSTSRGQMRSTSENRDHSDFAQTLWNGSGYEHEAPYKIFGPGSESFERQRSEWYSHNMGGWGRKLGKITTPQILMKLEQELAGRMIKYGIKYFSWAVSRLTSRGQIYIQITWEPMRENIGKITSLLQLTPTSWYSSVWNLQSTCNSILPGTE